MQQARRFSWLILLILSTTLLPPLAADAAPAGFSIPVPALAGGIQTDGAFIIWTAPRTSDYNGPHDLYAATFPDGQHVTVASDVNGSYGDGPTIGISNGVVTWLSGNGAQRTLQAKDLVLIEL